MRNCGLVSSNSNLNMGSCIKIVVPTPPFFRSRVPVPAACLAPVNEPVVREGSLEAGRGTFYPEVIASGQSSRASSRSLYFWILPEAVIGKLSMKWMYLGIL
jgi:hypothetical protein